LVAHACAIVVPTIVTTIAQLSEAKSTDDSSAPSVAELSRSIASAAEAIIMCSSTVRDSSDATIEDIPFDGFGKSLGELILTTCRMVGS